MAGIDKTLKFIPIRIAVLTVSDTRTTADDKSGDVLAERVSKAGHVLAARSIVKDDVGLIVKSLRQAIRHGAWPDESVAATPLNRSVPSPCQTP